MAGASTNKELKNATCKDMVSHPTLSLEAKGTVPLSLQSPVQLLSGIALCQSNPVVSWVRDPQKQKLP